MDSLRYLSFLFPLKLLPLSDILVMELCVLLNSRAYRRLLSMRTKLS
jgi:hypothetical protein